MTDTEKRRTELLQQTRQLYTEKYAPPAVHPRYRNAYQSLYKNEDTEKQKSSFGVRLVVAILLFGLFILASENKIKQVDTVVNEIKQDIWTNIQK